MNKQNKLNLFFCISIVWAVASSGCNGSNSGNAPGGTAPTVNNPGVIAPSKSSLESIKNGSLIQTSNGWSLQMDTSDPVKSLTTANGWKIEVKYE